ncbi:MAG: hypothetical protein ACJ763_01640 [Bdellovibrionia bacterium]
MRLGKLWIVVGVLFTCPYGFAEAPPSCINAQPAGPFTGGKFIPATTSRLVFRLAESKVFEDGSLNFDANVYETGTIENQGSKLSTLTAVVSVDEQMAGGETAYMAVRYAAKNGSVLHLTPLDFQVPEGPVYTAFFKSIEKKLETIYKAPTTLSSAPISGLSLPKCKLRTPHETWILQARSLPLSKSMHPVKLGPENASLKDESLWTGGDMDPLLYVKTPDQVYIGYSTERPYAFEHAGNKYRCSTEPSKRDPTTEQERHRIAYGVSDKDLKLLWTDPVFGAVYQPQGKSAERELADFRKRYDYNYDLVAKDSRIIAPSEPAPAPKLSVTDLNAKIPVVYVKDSFSRYYRCTADNLIPDISRFVEPLIYIYSGNKERVTVSLGPEVKIMGADPEPIKNSWEVNTDSKGHMRVDGARAYRSLFWEGRGPDFPAPPTAGVVLERDQVETYLSKQLPCLGLRGREVTEFIHYWAPVLKQHPAVLIDFILNHEVERFAPLITSRPMKKIRVYLNYRPLAPFDDKGFPRKHFPTLSRPEDNLLIEWGGIHWADSELR